MRSSNRCMVNGENHLTLPPPPPAAPLVRHGCGQVGLDGLDRVVQQQCDEVGGDDVDDKTSWLGRGGYAIPHEQDPPWILSV